MTRDHAQQYTKPGDAYAFARCLCGHLRYDDQKPGDPCWWCDCAEHVRPGETEGAARS